MNSDVFHMQQQNRYSVTTSIHNFYYFLLVVIMQPKLFCNNLLLCLVVRQIMALLTVRVYNMIMAPSRPEVTRHRTLIGSHILPFKQLSPYCCKHRTAWNHLWHLLITVCQCRDSPHFLLIFTELYLPQLLTKQKRWEYLKHTSYLATQLELWRQ